MVQMPAVNTPQFSWVLSRLPKAGQPCHPIYQPEVAARAVVYAADHPRRREYWVGASTAGTWPPTRWRARADDLRGLAPPVRRWPEQVRDPALRDGVAALASAVADLVEVLGLDQDVLADRARAGARTYAGIEQSLAATSMTSGAVTPRLTL